MARPAYQRRRTGLLPLAAPAVSHASRQTRAGQGQRRRPGRREGRLLSDLHLSDPGDDVTAGQQLVDWVQQRIDAFADTWASRYPAAVKCLLTDRQGLTTNLCFPLEHHRRVRHSNFIERTFGETRRRVKVIGRFPSGTASPWFGPSLTEPPAAGAAPPIPATSCASCTTSAKPCTTRPLAPPGRRPSPGPVSEAA
ncbi:transposase [Nonomuraea salmonea]|uniref:Transposase n=1 Tax=Nonomuraea salmonea TaxID=46181 RepID=A0ABV5NWQ9_9ACTN